MSSLFRYLYQTRLWNRLSKNSRELAYWRGNINKMIDWYTGVEQWRWPFPSEEQKEKRFDLRKNAIMTYIGFENDNASYLRDLQLSASAFEGGRVADFGSGPLPTLLVFNNCERYCLDHLMDTYRQIGYPLEEYERQITFVNCKSECVPFPDAFFDAVLSRNALDHVDDFQKTASEMKRVLRPGGVLRILVNYHPPTKTETQMLSDELVTRAFAGLEIEKVSEESGAWGFPDGTTVLWSTAQ